MIRLSTISAIRAHLLLLAVFALTSACHRSRNSSVTTTAAVEARPSGNPAIDAARTEAETNPLCTAIRPFYWEIGDAHAALGDGTVGGAEPTASTHMAIASASKWIWGAYVVERFKDDPNGIDQKAMTMRSGYTDFGVGVTCREVKGCIEGKNGRLEPGEVGFFHYGGGHFQKYAVDLGLGDMSTHALAAEIGSKLGPELHVEYKEPTPAAGGELDGAHYAMFLRKMLGGELAIGHRLGADAVCTLPGTCATAHHTPVPYAWHYSYGHWVEDDAQGDHAFSSPGLFGFYPWIDASKRHYGVIVRHSFAKDAYMESVHCGQAIRRAFSSR
jgi:hypothetical protein